jgi:hypothetical protein
MDQSMLETETAWYTCRYTRHSEVRKLRGRVNCLPSTLESLHPTEQPQPLPLQNLRNFSCNRVTLGLPNLSNLSSGKGRGVRGYSNKEEETRNGKTQPQKPLGAHICLQCSFHNSTLLGASFWAHGTLDCYLKPRRWPHSTISNRSLHVVNSLTQMWLRLAPSLTSFLPWTVTGPPASIFFSNWLTVTVMLFLFPSLIKVQLKNKNCTHL